MIKRDLIFLVLTGLILASLIVWSSTKVQSGSTQQFHKTNVRVTRTSNGANEQTNSTEDQMSYSSNQQTDNSANSKDKKREPKILCFILTVNLVSHDDKRNAVHDTWGKRCDKLLFIESGPELVESDGILKVPLKKESRENLWHKVAEATQYLYDRYLNEYDWFMKADDDTYTIIETLKSFLRNHSSPEQPIYFGYKFKPYVRQGYMSGGAGYVLSRHALKLLVEQGFQRKLEECHLKAGTVEDVEMGRCLEAVGVTAGDSRDVNGRPTFLALSPVDLINESEINKDFWYFSYNFYGDPKPGKECCSDEPISFHYIEPKLMRFIDWLLYDVKKINKGLT